MCCTVTLNEHCKEIGLSLFGNNFTEDAWIFLNNKKHEKMDKKAFYMSNIIALQYETVFKENKWLMALPKTIVRSNITNPNTNSVLEAHRGNYGSDKFMKDFLTTVNGKSTKTVAEDFGLKINKLTVDEVDRHEYVREEGKVMVTGKAFNVTCHVSPDPDVYGAP